MGLENRAGIYRPGLLVCLVFVDVASEMVGESPQACLDAKMKWQGYLRKHSDRIGWRNKSCSIHAQRIEDRGCDILFVRHARNFAKYQAKKLEGNICVSGSGIRSEEGHQAFGDHDQIYGH